MMDLTSVDEPSEQLAHLMDIRAENRKQAPDVVQFPIPLLSQIKTPLAEIVSDSRQRTNGPYTQTLVN